MELSKLAHNRFFDPTEFENFARENAETFKVSVDSDNVGSVSDWFINELVDAYKAFLGDRYEKQRVAQLELRGYVKAKNPENPEDRLNEVGLEILKKVTETQELYTSEIENMRALIYNDPGLFAEFISESMSDFATHIAARVMPVYNRDYIDFWPKIDLWVYENIHKKGTEAVLAAMIYDRGKDGCENVCGVMRNLASVEPTPGL